MIDNFNLLKSLLTFNNQYDFYDLQIIRRGKDHPNLSSANKTFKSHYIESIEQIEHLKAEIIKMCETFGCRAYIYPSVKNFKDVVMSTIAEYARRAKEGDFKRPHKIFASCTGKEKSKNPIWVVDFDEKDNEKLNEVILFIENNCRPNKKIVGVIPTKNGYHILTHPFDKMTFKEKYPEIEIKDNNPTILYIPDSI